MAGDLCCQYAAADTVAGPAVAAEKSVALDIVPAIVAAEIAARYGPVPEHVYSGSNNPNYAIYCDRPATDPNDIRIVSAAPGERGGILRIVEYIAQLARRATPAAAVARDAVPQRRAAWLRQRFL